MEEKIYNKSLLIRKIEKEFEDNEIVWREYISIKEWLETLE